MPNPIQLQAFAEAAETSAPGFVTVPFLATSRGRGLTFLGETDLYDVLDTDLDGDRAVDVDGNGSINESILTVETFDAIPFTLRTVLMLDNSASIGANLPKLRAAAHEFIDRMLPQQQVAMYTFSEDIERLVEFTNDRTALRRAVDDIRLGRATTNLFGAIVEGARAWDDTYSITREDSEFNYGSMVVLSDGADTRGVFTEAQTLDSVGVKAIVTVSVGDDPAHRSALARLHTAPFIPAQSIERFEAVGDAFAVYQRELERVSQSFYWLTYASTRRPAPDGQSTAWRIRTSLKLRPNASFDVVYSADGQFTGVDPGVYVNRSVTALGGVTSLDVSAGRDTVLTAESLLLTAADPQYEWQPSDASVLSITPLTASGNVARVRFTGVVGDATTLVVVDTANEPFFGELARQTVTLRAGSQATPALTVATTPLVFEPIEPGGRDTLSVVVTNSGRGALAIQANVEGDAFELASAASEDLLPSASATVRVAFVPSSKGAFIGTLSLTHNAPGIASPLEINLSGRTPGEIACRTVALDAGWNLVSAPLIAASMTSVDLFPGTVNHFAYTDRYAPANEMVQGNGYWLQSDTERTIQTCGAAASVLTTQVAEGWNLVGPFHQPAAVADLVGTATLGSSFFGYARAYIAADTLRPGNGYWMKADAAGTLSFGASLGKDSQPLLLPAPPKDAIAVTVTDADGRQGVLFLVEPGRELTGGALPPRPPAGSFDVRFVTDSRVAFQIGADAVIQGASYPLTISAMSLGDHILRVENAVVREGAPITLAAQSERLRLVVEQEARTLALGRPRPSPFESQTLLDLDLPDPAQVVAHLYDALGRTVLILVDAPLSAGRHTLAIHGASLPAGVYFVRVQVDHDVLTQRVIRLNSN